MLPKYNLAGLKNNSEIRMFIKYLHSVFPEEVFHKVQHNKVCYVHIIK